MKKVFAFALILLLVLVAACQQSVKKENRITSTQTAETTGDASADSFGNGVSSIDNDEKDTNATGLEGVDSGLSDVGNI